MQIQKTSSNKKIITVLTLATLFFNSADANSTSFEIYKAQNEQNFLKEKEKFQEYKKAQMEAFSNYKRELEKYWSNPLINTKKQLVSYSQDKKSRSVINFDKNELTIQTLANNKKEAEQKLALTLAKAATFTTKDFYKHDELEQKLAKIEATHKIKRATIDTEPVLAPVLFQEKPTKKSLYKFIKKEVKPQKIIVKKSTKLNNEKIYTLHIKLPSDTTIKRSKIYYKDVKVQSRREQIPLSLIFAIIHSESSFNPMARSHIPAYGLMQIVPKTAGVDAYYYLYNKKRLVGSTYLYNAQNNIKMGSAYLHILYYKYLKHIKDPQSRLYCTIAAYNTGAGNVARAFVGTNNTYKAAQVINRLSPDEVYAKLIRDLRYDEPKVYLKNVTKRMKIYHKIYEG